MRAMTKKAKVIDYPGELGGPIVIRVVDHPPRLPSSTNGDPTQSDFGDFVKRVWRHKLSLLLSHYNIDPEDPQSWEQLAWDLAVAHVPGFQLELVGHRGGRPTTWSDDRAWLAITVDSKKARHPKLKTDEQACKHLAKVVTQWGRPENHKGNDRSWIKTLTNRLSEGRKTDLYKSATRAKGMSLRDLFLSSHEKPTSLASLLNSLSQSSPDNSEK
jgi:hypothetical protein